MRYMCLYKPGRESTAPPTEQEMTAMGKLIEEMARDGVLLATDGLQHSSKGVRVRINDDGKFTVTDGPFTETKELVAGFAIIQVKSKEEAIEYTKRFLNTVGAGESEVRLMQDQAGFDAQAQQPARAGAAR